MEKYQFDQTLMQTMEDSHIPFAVYQFIDKRVVTLVLSAGFRKLFEFDKKEDAYMPRASTFIRKTAPGWRSYGIPTKGSIPRQVTGRTAML